MMEHAATAISTGSLVLGGLGVLAVLLWAPRQSSPLSLLLVCSFLLLLAGGALGLSGIPDQKTWSESLLLVGAAGSTAGAVVVVLRSGSLDRSADEDSDDVSPSPLDRDAREQMRDDLDEIRTRLSNALRETPDRLEVDRDALRRQMDTLETLIRRERHAREIVESMRDGVALVHPKSLRVASANPAFSLLASVKPDELRGTKLQQLLAGDENAPAVDRIKRAAADGERLHTTLGDGASTGLPVEIAISTVEDPGGNVLVVVARDRGHAHDLERELEGNVQALQAANGELAERSRRIEQMNVRLRMLQEAKDHFVSSVSHELRTPLTSIRSFSEILLRHDGDAEMRKEFLEIIHRECERLTRLVNNVLDVARMEAGELRLVLSRFDVADVVSDALDAVMGHAREHQVRLGRTDDLEGRSLHADRDRVQQLLVNLLANAVQFSPEGGTVNVVVEDGTEADTIRISVVDRGAGIEPEDLDHIFEKFRQGSDGEAARKGTGLGLTICREIAAAHGAQIGVESVVGKGSTFWVEMPIEAEQRQIVATVAPLLDSK